MVINVDECDSDVRVEADESGEQEKTEQSLHVSVRYR